MLSKGLKAIRHGLKVAQFGLDVALLHFPCPDLRAGVCRALSVLMTLKRVESAVCLGMSNLKVIILEGILGPSCCLGFC